MYGGLCDQDKNNLSAMMEKKYWLEHGGRKGWKEIEEQLQKIILEEYLHEGKQEMEWDSRSREAPFLSSFFF